jgi:hypothetical protein
LVVAIVYTVVVDFVAAGLGVVWLINGMSVPGIVGIHDGSFGNPGMLKPGLAGLAVELPGVCVPAPVKMIDLICAQFDTRFSPMRMSPIQSTMRSLSFTLVVLHFPEKN